jgi:hypothetical protein
VLVFIIYLHTGLHPHTLKHTSLCVPRRPSQHPEPNLQIIPRPAPVRNQPTRIRTLLQLVKPYHDIIRYNLSLSQRLKIVTRVNPKNRFCSIAITQVLCFQLGIFNQNFIISCSIKRAQQHFVLSFKIQLIRTKHIHCKCFQARDK